jgi:hypothetical protein
MGAVARQDMAERPAGQDMTAPGPCGLQQDKSLTTTNVRKFTRESKLFPSGLLGALRLLAA